MTAREFQHQLQPGIDIDEISIGQGKFFSAYGHTPTMLIYFTKTGEAYATERDRTRQYADMHEELFTAKYDRDERYDLGKPLPAAEHQRKQEPRQLTLW